MPVQWRCQAVSQLETTTLDRYLVIWMHLVRAGTSLKFSLWGLCKYFGQKGGSEIKLCRFCLTRARQMCPQFFLVTPSENSADFLLNTGFTNSLFIYLVASFHWSVPEYITLKPELFDTKSIHYTLRKEHYYPVCFSVISNVTNRLCFSSSIPSPMSKHRQLAFLCELCSFGACMTLQTPQLSYGTSDIFHFSWCLVILLLKV